MLKLGQYQTLKIQRQAPPGQFLVDEEGEEVLLPNKYIPEDKEIGDDIEVFVYLDHEERPVTTTLKPLVTLRKFAHLRCVETTEIGAFLDWGLEKHLFVPFKEQAYPMEKNRWYLIYCYLDEKTQRLAASSKVNQFLDNSDIKLEPFEKVDLIVSNKTDLGFNVIINSKYQGLVYEDEVFQDLRAGNQLKGWVKKVREDNKIDVSLQRAGYRVIEPNAGKVLEELEKNNGFLGLHDKSSPDDIRDQLEMSKKSFKRAIGHLYKEKRIKIVPKEGIYLR